MRRGRGMRRGRRRLGPLLLGEVEDVHVIIVAGEALGRLAPSGELVVVLEVADHPRLRRTIKRRPSRAAS